MSFCNVNRFLIIAHQSSLLIPSVQIYVTLRTCLHLQRKLSRSLFSSSSTTVTRGARRETTPRSSGRKGWGPSWAKKDAKLRKLCLSVASAVSVEGKNDIWMLLKKNNTTATKAMFWKLDAKNLKLNLSESLTHLPFSTLRTTFLFSIRAL